jgi:L-lactate transport
MFVASVVFHMPADLLFAAAALGAAGGLFPIMWIIVNTLFLYRLTVASGRFEKIRQSLSLVSPDPRLQVLLIAICFGTLLEGVAGFGTPIPLCAVMLVGVGFTAPKAVLLSLLADSAPVAYGTLGNPINGLSAVTQPLLGQPYEAMQVVFGAMVGRQLALLYFLLPTVLVLVAVGWKGLRGVLPATLAVGFVSASTALVVTHCLGPTLTNVMIGMLSCVCLVALLRVWRPADSGYFAKRRPIAGGSGSVLAGEGRTVPVRRAVYTDDPGGPMGLRQICSAWLPFLLLTAIIIICTQTPLVSLLDGATIKAEWPLLHEAVAKAPPVLPPDQVGSPSACFPATFTLDWLRSASTLALIAALVAARFLGLGSRQTARIYMETLGELRPTTVSVVSVLALASVMNYAGMSTSLALVLITTGPLFPFFSSFIGWFGVFLTGSDVASNNLFGGLQVIAAQQLGLPVALTAATNCAGGTVGKMISPQALAIATAAVGISGLEGEVFSRVIRWSLALAALIGLIALAQAYLLPTSILAFGP